MALFAISFADSDNRKELSSSAPSDDYCQSPHLPLGNAREYAVAEVVKFLGIARIAGDQTLGEFDYNQTLDEFGYAVGEFDYNQTLDEFGYAVGEFDYNQTLDEFGYNEFFSSFPSWSGQKCQTPRLECPKNLVLSLTQISPRTS